MRTQGTVKHLAPNPHPHPNPHPNQGTVKHVFKAYVFIHSTDIKDNAGIACIRARQCQLTQP